jgi:dCTP deaminase
MILSGPEILKQQAVGLIVITPFCKDQLNPNSYDMLLGPEMMFYEREELMVGMDNPVVPLLPCRNGAFKLLPGQVYLGSTIEWTETYPPYVPMINGKSSLGRLGLTVHITAGFGDCGFKGHWTLELTVVKPLYIRPGERVCQISYTQMLGEPLLYNGRYQNQKGPVAYKP